MANRLNLRPNIPLQIVRQYVAQLIPNLVPFKLPIPCVKLAPSDGKKNRNNLNK